MKKVLIVLVLLVGGFLVWVSAKPDTYKVERSASIGAPTAVVFDHLEDLKAWSAWSPWDKRDPQMKKTFDGPPRGVGASYAWEGNKEVGKGKLTVIESQPPVQVKYKLEFFEPFAAVASSGFSLAPEGNAGSKVTWTMEGNANFVTKVFSVFKPMDAAIGADFEKGLATLKQTAEADAKQRVVAEAAAAEKARAEAETAEKAKAEAAAAALAAAPPASKGKGKAKGKGAR